MGCLAHWQNHLARWKRIWKQRSATGTKFNSDAAAFPCEAELVDYEGSAGTRTRIEQSQLDSTSRMSSELNRAPEDGIMTGELANWQPDLGTSASAPGPRARCPTGAGPVWLSFSIVFVSQHNVLDLQVRCGLSRNVVCGTHKRV